MKLIKLVPALELGNKLNVDVMDLPGGPDPDLPAGLGVLPEAEAPEGAEAGDEAGSFSILSDSWRKRCGITLEYGPRDIRELEGRDMDLQAMLDYYREKVYNLVRINISQDWACAGGMDEVMSIVAKHLEK